jgi:hypothetical protein
LIDVIRDPGPGFHARQPNAPLPIILAAQRRRGGLYALAEIIQRRARPG